MNDFDHFLKREMKVTHCVRYADDFVILHESREYLEKLLPKISSFLETRLKLSLHPDKVFIKTWASGVDFLGWVHFPDHRILRSTSRERMRERLHDHPTIETFSSYLGLLSHGNAHGILQTVTNDYWMLADETP